MKCEICHAKDATVHLTEVVNDVVTKFHLCETCARKKSEEMQAHFGLTDLVSSLMDFGPTVAEEEMREEKVKKCPGCGMSYHDFQKSGKLGCGECYESFKKELSVLLRKIHGSDRHVGKMPFMGKRSEKDLEKLQELKLELNKLVQAEEFEKAALVRDRINEIEKKLSSEQ